MTTTRQFAAQPSSVRAARQFTTERLADLPGEVRDAAELMVSELATNCVLHAQAAFAVSLTRRGDEVRVEVRDDAGGTPAKRSPAADEPRGRGLQIVEMFSDAWGVERGRGAGKTVWFLLGAERATSTV